MWGSQVVAGCVAGAWLSVCTGAHVGYAVAFQSDLDVVDAVSAAEDIRMLDFGAQHAVALAKSGQVYTIGDNHFGQSGLGIAEHAYVSCGCYACWSSALLALSVHSHSTLRPAALWHSQCTGFARFVKCQSCTTTAL